MMRIAATELLGRLDGRRQAALLILSMALSPLPMLGEAPARVPVAGTRHVIFYSDFEPNLNDALIAAGVAKKRAKAELFHSGDEAPCFEKLPESARAGWDGAVDYYAKLISPTGSNSTPRYLVRVQIVGFDEDLKAAADREFAEIARAFRTAAAPAYRACRWPAQDAKNRRWVEELKPGLARLEPKIAPRLEELYRTKWTGLPIPVDVVQTVDWSGANTILRDPGRGHILISIENPERAAVEVVFHEASHILMGRGAPVQKALVDAATAAGFRLPGDLWHVVLFFTTGEVVRGVLDDGHEPKYVPMLYEIFDRNASWAPYRTALESAWLPYVKGERSLPDAAAALTEVLRNQPPPPTPAGKPAN